MKRSFTFLIAAMALMIAIMGSGATAWGQSSYTITAKTNTGDGSSMSTSTPVGDIFTATTYPNAITTATKAYYNGSDGIKLGTSSASGTMEFSLKTAGQVKATKIVVNAKRYSSSKAATIIVNAGGVNGTAQSLTSSFANYEFTINNDIVDIELVSSKYCWVSSITVYYTAGYTVTYDCNGGTDGCPENQSGISGGTEINLPAAPTKGCNTFAGWNDGTNTYNAGATYTVNADVTMTAQWTPITYPITYYPNNETTGEEIIENKTCGTSYTIADNIFEYGEMTFTKWNTEEDGTGTDYLEGATYTTDAALTLYAQWTSATLYTVMYDCDDATSGCPEPAIFDVEAGDLPLAAAPEKTGFTFNGWNDGTNTYAAGDIYNVTEDVTFTAQWLENLEAPTFNVTGVSTGEANTYYATASVVISQSQEATIYYTTNGDTPTTSSSVYAEAIVVNTTGTTVVKALAVKSGYVDSPIAEQTIIIVQPNVAEFTNGVYSETFESSLGLWSAFNIAGTNVWSQGTVTVYSVDYKGANINGYQASDHDWLVSPKMVAENGKLVIDFETAARYKLTSGNEGYKLAVKYSTDYVGYGNPTTYTWTALNPTVATPTSSSIVTAESGDVVISGLANNAEVYVAFIYTSGSSSGQATQYIISNFEAKQCYPVTYDANEGTGTMTDANSPYAVGSEVTVMANGFTAPTGTAFETWNTQADGSGTDYMPAATFNMGTSAVTLYAQWSEPCTVTATMAATTAEYEYVSTGDNPSYNINLGSSVSALGGCDIYEYGYVYSTTEATPTLENGTKIQVGTTYTTVGVAFEATAIEGATLGDTYYVCSFATNNAGTAYSAVAQVTIPEAYPTYTISYSTNGNDETPAVVYQGNSIGTLATPTAANIPNGYVFKGWSANEVALTDDEPTYVTAATVPEGNMSLKAVFAIAEIGEIEYVMTQRSSITEGIYLVAALCSTTETDNFYFATGELTTSSNKDMYVTSDYTTIEEVAGTRKITSIPTDAKEFILVGNSTNGYTVEIGSGTNNYLGYSSTSNRKLATGNSYSTYKWVPVAKGSTYSDYGSALSSKNGTYYVVENSTSAGAAIRSYSSLDNGRGLFFFKKTNGLSYSSFCTSVTPISGDLSVATTIANTAYYISDEAYVPTNETATINGVLGNADASLLIVNDGAQLIHSNAGVAATVKKSITGYNGGTGNYYLIATPMASAVSTSGITIGTYDLYAYDEEQALWLNAKQEGSTFNTLNPQQGYLYANNATQEVSMAGTLNPSNDAMSYELSYARTTEDNFKGFNLVGNPFACNAYANTAYYVMNDNGDAFVPTESSVAIQPGQAILVQATALNQSVTFSKNAPEMSNNLSLNVSNQNGLCDRAILSFNEGKQLGKFVFNENNYRLSLNQNGKDYAVSSVEEEGEIPVCFKAPVSGNYTISVNTENLNVEYLHLIDNMTGADIDLLVEESYSFKSNRNDYASRFKLVFKANAQNDEMNEVESSFAYISNGEIVISNEGRATLQVIDMMGRVLNSQSINGDCRISVNGMTAGVYVLNLNGKTQKIVVR